MVRPGKLLAPLVLLAAGAALSACGTQHVSVASKDPGYHGAVLFSQRCAGCHSLAVAGTRGSAANVRTREIVNGPNFNVRCERPVTRILYAIENGGFSGAIMPQNIVVGQDARDVAMFVAAYAGVQTSSSRPGRSSYSNGPAAGAPGATQCRDQPIGTLPPAAGSAGSASSGAAGDLTGAQTAAGAAP